MVVGTINRTQPCVYRHFGFVWGTLGPSLALYWPSFGVPLAPFGCQWLRLRCPVGSHWPSWGALGCLGPPSGLFQNYMPKGAELIVKHGNIVTFGNSLPDLAGLATLAVPAVMVSRSAVRTPASTRTGGQDDLSFTNSLKISCTSFEISFVFSPFIYLSATLSVCRAW